jgi:hypothetical protein
MPPPGSTTYRLRFAVVAAALAVVVAATVWTLIRSADDSSSVPATATANATTASAKGPRVDKDNTVLASKSLGHAKHTAATSPLPPPGTPLAQIYDELKARADAGDADAASRLFHDTRRCGLALETLRSLPHETRRLLEDDISKLDAKNLKHRDENLEAIDNQLTKARADNDNCAGLTEEQLLLTPKMLRAAQLGDLQASDCYVFGTVMFNGGLIDHPQWLVDYKANAPVIAQNAKRKGDWRMVMLLQVAYRETDRYGLFSQVIGANPVQSYRHAKLALLGASQRDAAVFARDMASAAQGVSADDISAADAWAQDAYQRYFTSNPQNDALGYGGGCPDE